MAMPAPSPSCYVCWIWAEIHLLRRRRRRTLWLTLLLMGGILALLGVGVALTLRGGERVAAGLCSVALALFVAAGLRMLLGQIVRVQAAEVNRELALVALACESLGEHSCPPIAPSSERQRQILQQMGQALQLRRLADEVRGHGRIPGVSQPSWRGMRSDKRHVLTLEAAADALYLAHKGRRRG